MAWDFQFETRDLSAPDRFEAWRDISRSVVGVEAGTDAPQSFDGAFAGHSLGPVTFLRSITRASWYERTRSLADHSDEISLSFAGGNQSIQEPDGEVRRIPAGGAFLVCHDRPFTLAQTEAEDTSFHFVIERRPLIDLLPPGTPIGIRLDPGGRGILSLLRGYVPPLTSTTDEGALPDETKAMIGRHVVDLIAALLRPEADAAGAAELGGVKAARIKAIFDLVARHHARPDLSAGWIGLRLGISARQVHRLLEETPKTLQEHMLEARLLHAHDLLSEPFGSGAAISEVARRCGFASVSHFSRSFRTRFGDTPSGVRAEATRTAPDCPQHAGRALASERH